MKLRSRAYWQNLLIYGLAAWLFSLGLTGLLARGVDLPFSPVETGVFLLFFVFFWLIVLTFPYISLGIVLAIAAMAGLAYWNDPTVLERFLASDLFWEIDSTLRALVYYVGVRGYLVPELGYFVQVFSIASGLFSVIFLWRLGWYLLGFAALAAALFANLAWARQDPWMLWLFVGLLGLLMIASRRRFVSSEADQTRQFPAVVPIAILLILSFGLGSLIPSNWFFHDGTSRWVNQLDDRFQDYFRTDSRGLFTLGGGYNNTSSPINGLVNRTATPYLRVFGPAGSYYLRGSVFDEFSGKTWHGASTRGMQPFVTPPTYEQVDVFDPYRYQWFKQIDLQNVKVVITDGVDERIEDGEDWLKSDGFWDDWDLFFRAVNIVVEPLFTPQNVAYIPNAPYSIQSVERSGETGQFVPLGVDPINYDYSRFGRVERSHTSSNQAYQIGGHIVPTNNAQAEDMLLSLGVTPAFNDPYGNPVTHRELGLQIYRDSVMRHDPALGEVLYGNYPDIEKILFAKKYMENNYTYDLDVQAVPANRDFVDWFVENKVGYCVHYGSALALLLEDVGIPTRYVEGFVTGEISGVTADAAVFERVVTTDQAHAWTEVYLNGLGWYPMDATPANQRGQGLVEATPVGNDTVVEPEEETTEPAVVTDESELPAPDRITEDTEGGLGPGGETTEPGNREPFNLPMRWIVVIGLGLFLAWRRLVYKLRHHRPYLRRKYRGQEDRLVIRIFNDIQHLHVIGGYTIPRTWSSKQRFDDVLGKTTALDYKNAALAEQAIEEVYYAERPPSDEMIDGLISYHAKLELRVRNKLGWLEWFFRRFLWSPKHPL